MANNKVIYSAFFIIFSVISMPHADPKGDLFHEKILNIYNFYPHDLNKTEIKEKSAELDKFWNMVKSDKELYLPLLRKELQDYSNNTFFLFDGALLLTDITHLESETDNQIIAQSISKANLEDINHLHYFLLVWQLGAAGADTYPAIENILNTPDFSVFIVEHSLTLAQDYSLLYCLLFLDENRYIDKLIARLEGETNETTVKSIILNLAYTVTDKGQQAIKEFAARTKSPSLKKYAEFYMVLEEKSMLPEIKVTAKRTHFDQFLKDFAEGNFNAKGYNFNRLFKQSFYIVLRDDYDKIKLLRKHKALTLSDESLDQIKYFTMLLQYSFTSRN